MRTMRVIERYRYVDMRSSPKPPICEVLAVIEESPETPGAWAVRIEVLDPTTGKTLQFTQMISAVELMRGQAIDHILPYLADALKRYRGEAKG